MNLCRSMVSKSTDGAGIVPTMTDRGPAQSRSRERGSRSLLFLLSVDVQVKDFDGRYCGKEWDIQSASLLQSWEMYPTGETPNMETVEQHERTSDGKGRVYLGPDYSNREAEIVVKDNTVLIEFADSDGEQSGN